MSPATCGVRIFGLVAQTLEAKVRAQSFPLGYHPELLGEYQARSRARNQLALWSLLSLAGCLSLLYLDFGACG